MSQTMYDQFADAVAKQQGIKIFNILQTIIQTEPKRIPRCIYLLSKNVSQFSILDLEFFVIVQWEKLLLDETYYTEAFSIRLLWQCLKETRMLRETMDKLQNADLTSTQKEHWRRILYILEHETNTRMTEAIIVAILSDPLCYDMHISYIRIALLLVTRHLVANVQNKECVIPKLLRWLVKQNINETTSERYLWYKLCAYIEEDLWKYAHAPYVYEMIKPWVCNCRYIQFRRIVKSAACITLPIRWYEM